MKNLNFTLKALWAASLFFCVFLSSNAIKPPAWKTRMQPMVGTYYTGTNASTKQEQDAEYEFDKHGNTKIISRGTFSSMDMEEFEYNYDKGYAALFNHFYYTLDRTGTHDTLYTTQTIVNDQGIRTYYMTMPSYEFIDNFEFDAEGHITSLKTKNDTTLITWDGDRLATYKHHTKSSTSESLYQYDNIEVAFAYQPIKCMDYNFDNLISDFSETGVFVNATGRYKRYVSYNNIDVEGTLEVTTRVIGEDSIVSTAVINGTDTLYAQNFKMLDENGSYRLETRNPLFNGPDIYSEETIWYNEFGDVVKTEMVSYNPTWGNSTSVSEDRMEYDGNKPLNKKHYYYEGGEPMLGSLLEYTTWHEPEPPVEYTIEPPVWETRQQPATGTLYTGANATSKAEQDAEYEFDSHGNEVLESRGSFSSMDMEEHEYNYDKGYAVLLNHFYYTLDRTGTHDTLFMTKTGLNDQGIRTYYMTMPSYEYIDNFEFDAEGHITSLKTSSDTTLITWDGDQLATYDHHSRTSSVKSQVKYDNIETVFAYKPINCMDYDFDNLISDFSESGVFVNAKGHYIRYISWNNVDIEGELEVTSETVSEDSLKSIALLNGTDTLYAQYFKKLDENGSYRLETRSPLMSGNGVYTEKKVWYNEFGDIIKTETVSYNPTWGNSTSVSEDRMEYDGNKPLNKKHYYYEGGEPMLGSLLEYTTWHEPEPPVGISDPKEKEAEVLDGALYDTNGRKIADLSRFQIETGRFNVPSTGMYLLRENTTQGVRVRKIISKK